MELYIKVVFWWLVITVVSCLYDNYSNALTKKAKVVNMYCIVFCSCMALWGWSVVWA